MLRAGRRARTCAEALIEAEPLALRAAEADTPNGVYVHDRRSGERVEVVSVDSSPLARHASDELYGVRLAPGSMPT